MQYLPNYHKLDTSAVLHHSMYKLLLLWQWESWGEIAL